MIGTPVAALTGTADASTISKVKQLLVLKNPLEVRISPNRANIRISVMKAKKEHIMKNLDWLVKTVKVEGEKTPQTIIFCNTMNDIACVANFLMLKLGKAAYSPQDSTESNNCLIGIYHSSYWEQNKERVVDSLKNNMYIRVVVSSSALSMGVNFPNISYVVNFGPARSLLDQHQEFGRAGRDGRQSHALIIFHGQQLSQCEKAVKDFLKTQDGCLRVTAYKPFDDNITPQSPLHDCCSYCITICKCDGNSCARQPPIFEQSQCDSDSPRISLLTRPINYRRGQNGSKGSFE